LEEVGNPDDTPAGARPLIENMINKYKGKIDAIWCYNDASALGAYGAVKAAGLENVIITGNNGDVLGIDAVRNGFINITWDLNVVNIGKLAIEAVYEVLSGNKKIYEMPRTLVAPEIKYAKEDLDNYVPWQNAAEQLNNCSLPNGVVQFAK
jgi:ribose transport system substrate-binding protein